MMPASQYVHAQEQRVSEVPRYVVDPFWPRPLPNRWVTGEVGGVCIDKQDHVFGLNRLNVSALEKMLGKTPAPPVIEYDQAGRIVNAWGDLNALPRTLHSCYVDHEDSIWIVGSGGGMVQKWSHDGKKLLLQIGERDNCDGPCGEKDSLNASRERLNLPADIAVDPPTGDVYIADGYGNHRIVVFDAKGRYLRQWGSKGLAPGQFASIGAGHPHCVLIGQDGLVYVCDRGNDRIQVFDKTGSLKSVIPIKLGTAFSTGGDGLPGGERVGSANDLAFMGAQQRYLLVADPGNEQIWILDRALNHTVPPIVAGFGSPGHNAGNFTVVHGIDVDSQGVLYAAETVEGRRMQRFVRTGTMRTRGLPTYLGSYHYEAIPDEMSTAKQKSDATAP